MKTFITALAVTLGLATAASAGDLAWLASAEYAVEAEAFSVEAGAEFVVAGFTVTPMILADDVAGSFDFTGAELGVAYGVAEGVNVYGVLAADADFKYDELTVGVALKF